MHVCSAQASGAFLLGASCLPSPKRRVAPKSPAASPAERPDAPLRLHSSTYAFFCARDAGCSCREELKYSMPGDGAGPLACIYGPKQSLTAARVTSHQHGHPGVTAVCLSASTDRRPEGGVKLHAPTRKLNPIHPEGCWSAILGLRWRGDS